MGYQSPKLEIPWVYWMLFRNGLKVNLKYWFKNCINSSEWWRKNKTRNSVSNAKNLLNLLNWHCNVYSDCNCIIILSSHCWQNRHIWCIWKEILFFNLLSGENSSSRLFKQICCQSIHMFATSLLKMFNPFLCNYHYKKIFLF